MILKVPIQQVDSLATRHEWNKLCWNESIGMVSYFRDGVRINIYLSTMTVSTAMNHPKKGKTQLHRKNVTLKELDELFTNPRTHTGKGYYTK